MAKLILARVVEVLRGNLARLSVNSLISGGGVELFFATGAIPLWGSSWEGCAVVVGIIGKEVSQAAAPPHTPTRLVENIWFP